MNGWATWAVPIIPLVCISVSIWQAFHASGARRARRLLRLSAVKVCVHGAHTLPWCVCPLGARALRIVSNSSCLLADGGKGIHIFIAYSDAEAGEIGTVYQATNWFYCGTTKSASSSFIWPNKIVADDPEWGKFKDGQLRDERNIQGLTRIRRFAEEGAYRVKCSRRELRERMVREGFLFFKSPPKRRYVTFAGDRRLVKELRAALRWEVLPYPKRELVAA